MRLSGPARTVTFAGTLILLATMLGGCKKIDTPQKLLAQILSLAEKQKYEELKKHVYPLTMGSSNYQDLIIEGIREKKKWGEGAYSREALAEVIKNHLDKFGEMSEGMRDYALNEVQDEDLRKIIRDQPQDVLILEYKGATIAVAKIEEEYKLLYWESLNSIL